MAEVKFDQILDEYVAFCNDAGKINVNLYEEYNVMRGLRDSNGRGVLTGLTEVSDVKGFEVEEGHRVPIQGELYFQGYEIQDLVEGFHTSKYGFEEATFLLLFGKLPTESQLESFIEVLEDLRQLPESFNRDVIMKAPSRDMMNSITRSILQLYSYDDKADDTSIPNVLRQSLNLISQFPMLMVYGYHAYNYRMGDDLFIYAPSPELSTAENILMMLRENKKYTKLEAKILDLALVLHAEHGGGNNSSFTVHVVSSSGTDTYSAIAAALGSLKGPKHGGANIKVVHMFDDMMRTLPDWTDEEA